VLQVLYRLITKLNQEQGYHILPSVKIAPFSSLPNFSMQSSIFIPLLSKESNQNGYLANNSYIWPFFFMIIVFLVPNFNVFRIRTRLFFGEKIKTQMERLT
jgi:hypothetical protein